MSICVEYVWVGGNQELRSKIKVLYTEVSSIEDIPRWHFNGNATNQSGIENSDVVLVPRKMFTNPFLRVYIDYLVLCDTYTPIGVPTLTNTRYLAYDRFSQCVKEEPWFGVEQEYFLINPSTGKPLGFPPYGLPQPEGPYYCSVGIENTFGRFIAEQHMGYCLQAGIQIAGINSEIAPGQWEFQIGPCLGIDTSDQLWMARYILNRVAESNSVIVNYSSTPLDGDWSGSGCHVNYSTKKMREGTDTQDGLYYIMQAIDELELHHENDINVYGIHNEKRLTGDHETSPYYYFSKGVMDRGASVRINCETIRDKKGYLEDRRPGANCDPYLVTSQLFQTTVLDVNSL